MKNNYDFIVIGGGPAGMMSAIIASSRGAKVLLLEKNKILGKKLSISGNGRCNLTQAEFNLRKLVSVYGKNGPFLFSALHHFGPREIMDFFTNLGVKVKIENDGRVFPVSNSAKEVIEALKNNLLENKVEIKCGVEVKNIKITDSVVKSIILNNNTELVVKNLLIATGGLSYALTGSTGVGLKWAKKNGLEIMPTTPALVPLKIKEFCIKDWQGLALKNVELSVYQNNKKIISKIGAMLFTHFGISGPIVLNISKYVIVEEKNGEVKLKINFLPELSVKQLDERLQTDFKKFGNKFLKNFLIEFVPKRMVEGLVKYVKLDGEKNLAMITREERLKLVSLLNAFELTSAGNLGYNFAIVTNGGIALKEIDPRTMCSKKFANLYFAGEVIDLDGPTGGYNLQVAWATGHLAGSSIRL